MTAADYYRVKHTRRFVAGATTVDSLPTRFSDSLGLLYSVREIYLNEVYRFESETVEPRIVDVGANIGLSIRYFKRLYPRAKILGYEPDPDIFAMLQSNVGNLCDVELRNAAAWTENTTLKFYREGSLAGSSEVDCTGRGYEIEVLAERLKDELRKAPVDFLKMDIEGAESTLLFDIEDDLDQVKLLFFEYHSSPDRPQRLGELLELVRRKGFRFQINGLVAPKLPFVQRVKRGFDLQLNVYCFR
jgi:FkbM family methyltransferase